MAGRFPASGDIVEFWENLRAGRDCLSTPSDQELLAWGERPERLADPAYVRRRPRIDGADGFDTALFGMTPREAELLDPQHRLFFEIVHAALEHSGYDPASYAGDVGVYGGANVSRYRYDNVERNEQVNETAGGLAVSIGGSPDYLTTFPSYKLGLRGPSMSVLTACSTTLVAVHVACAAIRNGDCDMAVAGGVDLEFPLNLGYRSLTGGVEAADGVPRPFDKDATGTNFGNGAGAVVLKPLDAALADRDAVYAVILGSAINNDGDRKPGFTAPSIAGQSECIQRALRTARVDPRDISYVEAHATATPVGDPIELAGLVDAFREVADGPLPAQYCEIGTVKSNIGHLSQAAGIAGLIKTVLALWHEHLPPSINVKTPNPATDWESSPFRVITSGRRWPREPGRPRIAGVSSFGIGGTNAHVILAEAPVPDPLPSPGRPVEAVLWSAVAETVAQHQQDRLAAYFDRLPEPDFPHAAHTLRVGRTARKARRAVVARHARDAASALRDPARLLRHDGVERSVVFAFPGQGAQRPRMVRDLYDQVEIFRRGCDAAFEQLDSILEIDLRQVWTTGDEASLNQTLVAQPLLFTLEYALAHCLQHWGVRPRAVFGHSLGELVAAAVAGVFDFESGLRAVAARARLMHEAPPGQMLAVAIPADEASSLTDHGCTVAAVNADRQVVFAGPAAAVRDLSDRLRAQSRAVRLLQTTHAFHTPAMAEAARRWEEALGALPLRKPELTLISSATGQPVTPEQATSPAFWAAQLLRPVDFHAAASSVVAGAPTSIIEVGPGRTLTSLLRGRPDVRATRSQVFGLAPANGAHRMEDALARLWVGGTPVSYWHGIAAAGYRRVAAPGYPYQRQRYWVEPDPPQSTASRQPAAVATGSPPAPPADARENRRTWAAAQLEWFRDRAGRPPGPRLHPPHGTAIVLGTDEHAGMLRSALGRAGYQTVTVDPVAANAEGGFDPTDAAGWDASLQRVRAAGVEPDLVVHATLLAAPPAVPAGQLANDADEVVLSLHACAKSLIRQARRHRWAPRLLVLGRHLVDVSGSEPVNPAAATAPAVLRSLAHEVPELAVFCRDVGAGTPAGLLGQEIAELAEPLAAPLAALRGTARWLPRLRDMATGPPSDQTRLRYRGTYLITGGLGGIGLVMARALAHTGLEPRLALLGRSGLPPGDDPHRRATEAELAAITGFGAQVEVVQADVTDQASLASAVARVERRLGPVNGVVHSAGVAGGGLIERRHPADVRRVLAPKTHGVLNLAEVFADRPELDFLLLCSSQAGFAGLYGSADYAAGNAFLDAYAQSASGHERHTLSVQWPAWAQVGMAARSTVGIAALHRAAGRPADQSPADQGDTVERVALQRVYRPGTDWELDEHAANGQGALPGTALMELALVAVRANGHYREDEPLELRDVVFLEILRTVHPVEVRVVLAASPDGLRFRTQARPVGSGADWVDHAQGRVGPATRSPARDLDEVRGRLSQADFGSVDFAGWIDFGPRWDNISDYWAGPGEALARLQLAAAFHDDLAAHPLHPAMMDSATAILHDVPAGRHCVPFLYRSVRVYRSLPADLLVHARFNDGSSATPRPTDLDFYDAKTGALLIQVAGFTRREIGEPASPAPVTPGLLAVTDGAAAFLSLLSACLPPVVLVDTPGSRLQVPGVPWAGATAASAAPPLVSPTVDAGATLPPPADPQPTDQEAGSRSQLTSVLRELWKDVLGVPDIADGDDFFELGGSSLVAVMLVNRIKERLGVDLGAGALFELSTIDTIADHLAGAR